MNRDGVPLPSALSGQNVERIISIDSALLFLVTGTLTDLADRWTFEQTGSLTPEAAKDAISDMLWCFMTEGACALQYPQNWQINVLTGRLAVGGAMSPVLSNQPMTYHYTRITPDANGNRMDFDIFCMDGQYQVAVLARKGSPEGMTRIQIDGIDQGSLMDWYSATTLQNQWQGESISIPGDGHHTLSIKVEGKNASSSNYAFLPSFLFGYRTGDIP